MKILKHWRKTRQQSEVFKQFYTETQKRVMGQREQLQSSGWYTISEGSLSRRAVQGQCYRRNIVQVQVGQ